MPIQNIDSPPHRTESTPDAEPGLEYFPQDGNENNLMENAGIDSSERSSIHSFLPPIG